MRSGRSMKVATLVLLTTLFTTACDDDPASPRTVPLADFEGLYATVTVTFDPQGSAPAADVLNALDAAGTSPTLNIGRTGSFQLFFRDPSTGNVVTLGGTVEPTVDGARLVFSSQQQADLFLLPRTLPLTWDAEARSLSFSGSASVSRARLVELFPELYAEEQLFDPTPGILTVIFQVED